MSMTIAPAPAVPDVPAAPGTAGQAPAAPAPAAPAVPADIRGRVAELHAIRATAQAGPSEKATQAQHAKGKLTARERIGLLLDAGSFREVEQLRR
ncbi:carboxyl transferase domain-containing protein, partial [Streptomyces sp. NPDC005423]|uniref:carboxyl transferase domain-containing protein n=1 Tax=Streptomyces sp. NPDC005423 TaxID=3155343 RepID=UPI0033A49311